VAVQPRFRVSRSHTITHAHTPGRTPLNEWSASSRGRYLQTHNKQSRRTVGFEHGIPTT